MPLHYLNSDEIKWTHIALLLLVFYIVFLDNVMFKFCHSIENEMLVDPQKASINS